MKQINNDPKMKKAAVESVIVWIVIFTSFVSVFYFIINYSTVLRMKDNVDTLADYGSNYVATNGVGDDISNLLNSIAPAGIQAINADTNAICNSNDDGNFQVIFIVRSTNASYIFRDEPITSRRVSFNQVNSNTVTCDLSITLQNN